MSDSDLDDTLIELFRSEVETHSEVLSAALLSLERNPRDTSRIDEMMRAAHSIKGAARVVGVEPAVGVAHVMEDCFVAAQKGEISFSPGDVDVLLRGLDLLVKISAATKDPKLDLAKEFNRFVDAQVVELQAVLAGTWKSVAALPLAAEPATVAPPKPGSGHIGTIPSVVTISVPELLDAATAERLRVRFLSAIESRCDTIQFDLRATRDLDVQGLAFLAAVPRHLAEHGRSLLELAGVSGEMATVLRVTGLARSFGMNRVASREAE